MKIEDYRAILKKYWGYDDFRGIQREIIASISAGRDTLGLMPTGGGKSITFQVPALAQEGCCIVITPLIALMKDQVQHLRQRGIRAAAVYSGMSHDQVLMTLENAVFGAVKLLYVSPERLSSELFRKKLRHIQVSFLCVDEAHCISQWGYDFRPSYLAIADIRRELPPQTPVLALTATATPAVVDDIQQRLGFSERCVFRMSFERKNLSYVVRQAPDKDEQLVHILNNVAGSAIVYVRSRQRTHDTAKMLQKAGISAIHFHAGLDDATKDRRQQDWQHDRVRVMVATNAFGMGIDKPDVRLVVHTDCPSSPEAYFQEAGRAGRDGKKAYAVLLFNHSDLSKLDKRIADTFPPLDYVRQVYDHLAYFYQVGVGSGYNATFEFPIDKFCLAFKHFPIQVEAALRILTRAGYIEYTEEQDNQARLMFTLERDDLYRLRGNSATEDHIIVSLLRHYTGLFTSYVYIDETLLAEENDMNRHEVYLTLKQLEDKHIVSYIPQKRTPHIRYTQRREESQYLLFPPEVYADLKARFQERIAAMMRYATNDAECRSRQLLAYFGETSSKDCGHCDVCLAQQGHFEQADKQSEARAAILALLADHGRHFVDELHRLPLPYEQLEPALSRLLADEAIVIDDGYLQLP